MLDTAELRNLSLDELAEKLNRLKKDLMQYRFQAKTGKLERQSTLREVRRDIARILTVMNEQKKAKKEAGVKA
jgi:large subunit ribosomal protein L29